MIKWQLYPPGSTELFIGDRAFDTGIWFSYMMLAAFFLGIMIYVLKQKNIEVKPKKARKASAALKSAEMSHKSYVLRWLAFVPILGVTLAAGGFALGTFLTGYLNPQIEGGLVVALPVLVFVSSLFFPNKPLLERIEPVLFIVPIPLIIMKLGCYTSQFNHGIPVSWSFPVWEFSEPAKKYGNPDVRIFPFSTVVIIMLVTAMVLNIILRKKGKYFQHIAPLAYGAVYFLSPFMGRELPAYGPDFLHLNLVSICQIIVLGWGIYFLLLGRREKARQEELRKKRRGRQQG